MHKLEDTFKTVVQVLITTSTKLSKQCLHIYIFVKNVDRGKINREDVPD